MLPVSRRVLVAACVAAVLHALPSFYWAFGGTALVWTLGSWAPQLQREQPVLTLVVLVVVGLVKLAGGVVPLLNAAGRLPFPRVWRVLCWVGALVLVAYGGAITLLGGAALAGLFGPVPEENRVALLGHVALWDPLFAVWGLLLMTGLLLERRERLRRIRVQRDSALSPPEPPAGLPRPRPPSRRRRGA